jgi:hypothetical protein
MNKVRETDTERKKIFRDRKKEERKANKHHK